MAAAQWQVAAILAVAWTLTLLYGEWLQFLLHAPLCRDLLPVRTDVQRMDRRGFENRFTVAVISSPKIVVNSGRALMAHQISNDLKLRRRFRSNILHRAGPDLVVVLGDLFSRPLPLTGNEWDSSLRRYRHIFDPVLHIHGTRRSLRRRRRQKIPRVLQIPGPTDALQSPGALAAMEEYFSQLSNAFSLDLNFAESSQDDVFNVVGLNSAAADGNRSSHHTKTFWNFVDQSKERGGGGSKSGSAVVAVSPLPMANSKESTCVSLRHSYWLPTQVSKELSLNSTSRILSSLRPSLFISGHDRETCWLAMHSPGSSSSNSEMNSELRLLQSRGKNGTAGSSLLGGQILLGSFNPSKAQAAAPFLLLSSTQEPFQDVSQNQTKEATPKLHLQLCVCASQLGFTIWYYFLLVSSVLAFLLTPPRGPMPLDELGNAVQHLRNQLKVEKLKSEDGDVSYVQIMDAEGNLVLAPKLEAARDTFGEAVPVSGSVFKESGVQQRARQGRDPEMGHTGHSHAPSQGGGKGVAEKAPGFSLSVLRGRLMSSAGPLAVLVGCELAFYLGLLASDWA